MKDGDYAIAARYARFVSPGFVLDDLVGFLNGYPIKRRFRRWMYIPEKTALRLLHLLNSVPDKTRQYISEIRILEEYSLKKYGVLYHDRVTGFSWNAVADYL